jgi:hypothetical protein
MLLAAALTVALSGAALAQERGQEQSRDRRSPAAEAQPRRPARGQGASQQQTTPQWQQGRQEHDQDRGRPTSQWQQGRQDQDRDGDRARVTPTWQQGRTDRDRDGDRDDRYRSGQVYSNGGYYPNSGSYPYSQYPTGAYSGYGRQGASQAQQVGYQDGLNDGSNDRATGHSYRPTEDSNYRHANRGWNSGMIDRDSYSSAYRQAYMQGYQRGYGRSW